MSLLLAILAQVGPFPQPGPQPVSPLPPEIVERQRQERAAERQPDPVAPPAPRVSARMGECLAELLANPSTAVELAGEWLESAAGAERAEAGQCRGMALTQLQQWDEAQAAFLAARVATEAGGHAQRARLAAMAGNAALARGDARAALAAFDLARSDARSASDPFIAGALATDRSRALVALGRNEEARASLAEARSASPANPQAWLLSATLSRRLGDLASAQAQIQEAARLLPIDPEIGLEAGVIAMLAGNEAAARKSWQSVIAAAPGSAAAGTARGYLAQLGETQTPTR